LASRAIWSDIHSSITVEEEATTVSWNALLQVHNTLPKAWIDDGWYMQTSVDYRWKASAENVCCKSGKIKVTASGAGVRLAEKVIIGPGWGDVKEILSETEGTFYSGPASAVHDVPKGEHKDLGEIYLGANTQWPCGRSSLFMMAEAKVAVECVH
jgi:hypothetical protein